MIVNVVNSVNLYLSICLYISTLLVTYVDSSVNRDP